MGQSLSRQNSSRGLSELTLVLDTGADMTVIDAKFLRELGLKPQNNKERIRLITGSGHELATKIVVPKLHTLGQTHKKYGSRVFQSAGNDWS